MMPSYEPLRGRGGQILPTDEDFPGDYATYLTEKIASSQLPPKTSWSDRIDVAVVRFLDGVSFWGLVAAGGVGALALAAVLVAGILRSLGVLK